MSMIMAGLLLLAGQLATTQVPLPGPLPPSGGSDPAMSAPQAPPPQQLTPEDYLRIAQGILDGLPTLPREARDAAAKLRDAFQGLARTYAAAPDAPIAAPNVDATPRQDWKLGFDDFERALTEILGGGASPSAMSGEDSADIGVPNLDPELRRQLTLLRENVELFYVTATGLGPGHAMMSVPAGR